jgi:hypothetical protein
MTEEDLELFILSFVAQVRRERWRTLIGSKNGRKRLVATFAHGFDFDPRWATNLGRTATTESIVELLQKKGAGATCYVLSQDSEIDGATLPLGEAVETVLHAGFGTYLIFNPERLAFFESEEIGNHFILERPADKTNAI